MMAITIFIMVELYFQVFPPFTILHFSSVPGIAEMTEKTVPSDNALFIILSLLNLVHLTAKEIVEVCEWIEVFIVNNTKGQTHCLSTVFLCERG
jgi:hypothetical protein